MNRAAEQVRIEWLVLRSQAGETAAFAELVGILQPRLIRHAQYLLGAEASAALDVVQESWLVILRTLQRLDDPAFFRGWAYRIVSNNCINRIRSAVRERCALSERPTSATHDSTDDDAMVRDAMMRLGPNERVILSLRYLEDMSTREIASILEIPPGTVKSRLHSAREQLKTILERSET